MGWLRRISRDTTAFKPLNASFGFTERAHQDYVGEGLTDEQIKNREFLKELMMRHGFVPIRCEWWHFNVPNWRDYTPVDSTFAELNATSRS